MQQDERFYEMRFASQADYDAWQADLIGYGSAVVDQHGKHVPLTEWVKPQDEDERD